MIFAFARDMRRAAITDDEVLLAAEQHDHVGVTDFGRRAIQAALEVAEDVGVIVRNQTARLLFGHDRQARRFDEALHRFARERVAGGAAGDQQRLLRLAQERDRLPHLFGIAEHAGIGPIGIRSYQRHVVFLDALLLHVDGNRQMHRPAPPAERQAHGAGDVFRNPARIRNHERTLAHGFGHANLIDFLLGATA